MDFISSNLHPEDILGKRVLEIGSLDINGSPRSLICQHSPSLYIGIDEQGGPGVDIQMSGDHLYSIFLHESFDIVICAEVLEHAKNWKQLVNQIKYILRPGGILILTCRAPGCPFHPEPADYWRFTATDLIRAFADFRLGCIIHDTVVPGILTRLHKQPLVNLSDIEPAIAIDENPDSSSLPL